MLFNSFIFFIFLAAVLAVYLLSPHRRSRAVTLLVASYAFYAYWDWRFTSLLALATTVDFLVGLGLERAGEKRRRKRLLWISCLMNLGILGVFKYFNFFVDGVQALIRIAGTPSRVVPCPPRVADRHLVLHVQDAVLHDRCLSPEVQADPFPARLRVVRGLLPQSRRRTDRACREPPAADRRLEAADTRATSRRAVVLIALGLFKKVLIGDAAGRIVNNVFGQPELYRSPEIAGGARPLLDPDLRRLRGLLQHRERSREALRRRAREELRAAVPLALLQRVLAALAHLALDLDLGLSCSIR